MSTIINEKSHEFPYIDGYVETKKGSIPRILTKLSSADYWGAWKVRWGNGRMNYKVNPGLYAVGAPDQSSPVLVSANYKLTFDTVRKNLVGVNAWLLILDTKGVNVWCAAGKGTFGTQEIVARVLKSGLFDIVTHRTLIVPQLGAPGVEAHIVARNTGFKVMYGPVRASDIKEYLALGMKKTEAMKRVHFTMIDRLVLVPLELTGAKKEAALLALIFSAAGVLAHGLHLSAIIWPLFILGGLLSGAALTPIFLPFIPFRAFSLKGAIVGLLFSALVYRLFHLPIAEAVFLALIATALSAYAALQFTGASTYTSENGVRKEIRYSLPFIYGTAGVGIAGIVVVMILSLIKKGVLS